MADTQHVGSLQDRNVWSEGYEKDGGHATCGPLEDRNVGVKSELKKNKQINKLAGRRTNKGTEGWRARNMWALSNIDHQ